MLRLSSVLRMNLLALSILLLGTWLPPSSAQSGAAASPWMNARLSPDERAALVLKEMTLDEKIALLHGTGMIDLSPMSPLAVHSNGGAGYVVGVPRLGIPDIQMSDAAYGVRDSAKNGRYSTALPSDLAGAASWATGASSVPGLAVFPSNSAAKDFCSMTSGAVSAEKKLPCRPSNASLVL